MGEIINNERITNKVVLSLEDYLELRDKSIMMDNNVITLISCLLDSAKLNSDGIDLKLDKYYIKSEIVKELIKLISPKMYNTVLETLKNEE